MLLYMYIAPGQGHTTPWGQMLLLTESPYHFAHSLQVLKQSLWSMILNKFLMISYIVYSPGARADNPLWTNFWCQQKVYITLPICCRFKKKIALKSDFVYIFFMFHHMYIAPGRGWQSIRDKILMTTERPFRFAHMLQVSKWSLLNLILYTFLMISARTYIAPGQRQKTP